MLRVVAALALIIASGCSKAEPKAAPTGDPGAKATVPNGPRRIAVEAGEEGYKPAEIPGKPGENLVLVFTRTIEGDCLAKVKFPDGKSFDLPMNKPTDVPVTVPASGKIEFVCAMDMFKGSVVAQP